jgi:hypothetical protein
MKKSIKKIKMKKLLIFSTLLLADICFASAPILEEVKKTFKQSYTINGNTVIEISNKYGEVKFEDTPGNTISITVVATVKASSKSRSEEALSNINVIFSGTSNLVSAKTEIEQTKSSWSSWFGSDNISYRIDYYIKCPSKQVINVTNKYGNIILPTWNNKANITVAYGGLNAPKVVGPLTVTDSYSDLIIGDVAGALTIKSKYSEYELGSARSLSMIMDYGDLKATSLGNANIDVDYSDIEIGKMNDLTVDCDYSDIIVSSCGDFIANGDYSDFVLGALSKSLTSTQRYGSLKVTNAIQATGPIKVNGSYTDVSITGVDDYTLTFSGRYCTPNVGAGFNYTLKDKSGSSYSLNGKSGSGKIPVNVSMSYGSFNFR